MSGAGRPSPVDAGYAPFRPANPAPRPPLPLYLLAAAALVVIVPVALERAVRRAGGPPLAGA